MMKTGTERAVFCFSAVRQDTLAHIVDIEIEATSYQEATSKLKQMWTEANTLFVHSALKLIKEE